MGESLLKTLNRYNFSKHPIKRVRDRVALPKQNKVKVYNEAKKEPAEQPGNATKPDEELAKVVLPILESAGINPDNFSSLKVAFYASSVFLFSHVTISVFFCSASVPPL